jgi:L-fuconolactonase
MIGSDWPVCRLAGSYEQVMAIVPRYAAKLSDDERRAVLGAVCAAFYRLPEHKANPRDKLGSR